MNKIEKGILLIAEPFLKDIHFQRSVVLLCQHEEAGTFGISINMLLNNDISTYIEEFEGHNIPVYDGGPVNRNHIHFLHQYPDLIPGGEHIIDGIFWGGNYEIATTLIKNGSIQDNGIRFYIGYSGWGEDQLNQEMKEKSWLTVSATKNLVFDKNTDDIWKNAIKKLGDEFLPMINYPLDPTFN